MKRTLYILLFMMLCSQSMSAQLQSVSGDLVNGRNGKEKCDKVSVTLRINSNVISTVHTDVNGSFYFDLTSVSTEDISTDPGFELEQNYPNPFREITSIPFQLKEEGFVKLDIYDIRGHKVRSILQEYRQSGSHFPQWNGRNERGMFCSQGIYIYALRFGGKTEIRKMTLLNASSILSDIVHPRTSVLSKSSTEHLIELKISHSDIEDTTLLRTISELPSSLNFPNIPVHVYPFLRTVPDTLSLMKGEDARDTLDIYFERPFSISSNTAGIEMDVSPDSLTHVQYKNVSSSTVLLGLKEIGTSRTKYERVFFNISPRLALDPKQMRRAYSGIPYQELLPVVNAEGETLVTPLTTLPSPLIFLNLGIQGTPDEHFNAYLQFELKDDRNITVRDSALLFVADTLNIDFNNYIQDNISEYPTDGTHPYSWVGGYTGVTQDMYYKGQRIASANPNGSRSAYCSGLTFENFFLGIQRLLEDLGRDEDINGMSVSDMNDFRRKWFVLSLNGDGPGLALAAYGLGDVIDRFEDVLTGDYLQLWRTSGSGHSVVFMNWTTNTAGDTTGFRYWSTQPGTSGINYNTEYFTGHGGNVDPAYCYFSRVRSPEYFTPFNK